MDWWSSAGAGGSRAGRTDAIAAGGRKGGAMADVPHTSEQGSLDADMVNHLWPPFTQMKGLKPVIMERAPRGCLHLVCHGSSLATAVHARSIHPGGTT